MLKQKVRIHHIPIALAVFIVVTASSFYALKIFAQTVNTATSPPLCASHACSNWSACSSSGTMTRTCSYSPSGCQGGDSAYTSQTCTPATTSTTITTTTPSCNYNISDWSECNSSGTQHRSYSVTNQPCVSDNPPATQRSCTYSPPVSTTPATSSSSPIYPECKYDYSAWGTCSSSGTQTRSYSITNQPCTPSSAPITRQGCASIATANTATTTLNCTPACSAWSSCLSGGYSQRSCTAPLGCPSSGGWVEKNSCTYYSPTVATSGTGGTASTGSTTTTTTTTTAASAPIVSCTNQCSAWSDCKPGGYQSQICQKPSGSSCVAVEDRRSCVYSSPDTSGSSTSAPTNCSSMCSVWSVCSPAGVKAQSCWPTPAGCPGETKTVTSGCAPIVCKFNYSDWGVCASGYQYRTVSSALPPGCVGGEQNILQECTEVETESQAGGTSGTASQESSNAVALEQSQPTISAPVDPENSVNNDWKKETFRTETCPDQICGGGADPDKDGLANNDEFRYGTDPKNRDTDNDGKTDGEEIASGTNPLQSSSEGGKDTMTFESPKDAGMVKADIYEVTNVEMVAATEGGEKYLRVSGKGPALSYITVYIYSGDPIIVTVKTDSNGDWTYAVDKKLDDGNHEVYVAVTNNTGAIKAKSEPLPFVKTAQAVKVAGENNVVEPASKAGISVTKVLYILAAGFFAVVLAFVLLGFIIKKLASKINLN